MANVKQNAPLPPFLTLTDGTIIRLTAYDAATGAQVSDVRIAGVSFTVNQESGIADPELTRVAPNYFPGGGPA